MAKSDTCKPVRWASILLVLLLLLSVVPFQALATETDDSTTEATYTLTGTFDQQFELSSKDEALFHLEEIVPGDSWTGKIKIQNDSPGQMAVCLKTITSDIRDTVLFDALALDISYEGKSIYNGSYNTSMTQITERYKIDPKKSLVFDVKVSLPVSAGNEVSNRIMDSTWTFEAIYTEKPQTGDNMVSENTVNFYVLWVMIFALIAVAIVIVRIRFAAKAQKAETAKMEQPKEDSEK